MMKRLLSFCLVFALGTLLAVAGEKITYRFAPELGKTLTYRITSTIEDSYPTKHSQKLETSMTTHIKATALENEVYTMVINMTDFEISLPNMPKNAKMEATLKDINELFSQITITNQMDKHGAVKNVEVKGLPKELLGQFSSQLEQMELNSQLQRFPSTPIGEGDTWKNNIKDNQKEMQAESCLTKITPTTLTVKSKGVLKMNTGNNFTFESEVQYDRSTGQQIPGTMTMDLLGTVKTNNSPSLINIKVTM
mgnify:CR=1 FL=1